VKCGRRVGSDLSSVTPSRRGVGKRNESKETTVRLCDNIITYITPQYMASRWRKKKSLYHLILWYNASRNQFPVCPHLSRPPHTHSPYSTHTRKQPDGRWPMVYVYVPPVQRKLPSKYAYNEYNNNNNNMYCLYYIRLFVCVFSSPSWNPAGGETAYNGDYTRIILWYYCILGTRD